MNVSWSVGNYVVGAEGAMRSRVYQKWESVMYETAVRACVVNFLRKSIAIQDFVDYHLKGEQRRGFVWVEDMGDFLNKYEKNRDKYPTFESFFSEFVKHLNDYAIQAK